VVKATGAVRAVLRGPAWAGGGWGFRAAGAVNRELVILVLLCVTPRWLVDLVGKNLEVLLATGMALGGGSESGWALRVRRRVTVGVGTLGVSPTLRRAIPRRRSAGLGRAGIVCPAALLARGRCGP